MTQRNHDGTVPPSRPESPSPDKLLKQPLLGAKLLIAEDFELNRNLFKTFLQHLAAEVDTAENGLQVLEHIERNQSSHPARPYDAIIMDIHMPVMDGIEATRRIRAHQHHADIPIIGLSATTSFGNAHQDCLSLGMNDFVRKPVDVDELLSVLSKWLHLHQPD